MKKSTKLIIAATCLAAPLTVFADSSIEVKAPDDGGISTVPLNLSTKITFGATGFEIANEGLQTVAFSYANSESISFKSVQTGIASAQVSSQFSLKRNPVESQLDIAGFNGSEVPLSVFSLSGESMLSIARWQGEAVNVSSLSAGVYILKINNQTIKFIKK